MMDECLVDIFRRVALLTAALQNWKARYFYHIYLFYWRHEKNRSVSNYFSHAVYPSIRRHHKDLSFYFVTLLFFPSPLTIDLVRMIWQYHPKFCPLVYF